VKAAYGRFCEESSAGALTRELMAPLRQWLEEHTARRHESAVPCSELYEAFAAFARAANFPLPTANGFGRAMDAFGYPVVQRRVRGRRCKCYAGLSLL